SATELLEEVGEAAPPCPATEEVVEVELDVLPAGPSSRKASAAARIATPGAAERPTRRLEVGAEAVVRLALLWVVEDLERPLHFLELLLGFRVVRVAVGVVLPREVPIRLAYLLFAGPAGEAKNFVVVVCHRSFAAVASGVH